MTFFQAVESCFRKYVTFSGRAARSEFWYWVLFTFLAGFIIGFVEGVMAGMSDGSPNQLISTLFSLATFLPGLAVTARRLHDVNRSGWWMLIAFTIIGLIPLLIWYCSKGTDGDNRFGPDPLALQA